MDVKNLETFVMVNELKSFTLAAGRLGYTQSQTVGKGAVHPSV